MSIETSKPPVTTERVTTVSEKLDHPSIRGKSLGSFLLRVIAVAIGMLIGAVVALYLALVFGWVGC